jgi:hypothetical protein
MRANSPIRVLAVAVIRQAMLDYRNGFGAERMSSAGFLAGEGKEIWEALGFRPSLIDEFLANPSGVRGERSEPSGGRGKR